MNRRDILAAVAATGVATVASTGVVAGNSSMSPIPFEPEASFVLRLHEWVIDQELDGKDERILLTRKAFKHMRLHNQIDYLPDPEGKLIIPTFMGHAISVPGTALA